MLQCSHFEDVEMYQQLVAWEGPGASLRAVLLCQCGLRHPGPSNVRTQAFNRLVMVVFNRYAALDASRDCWCDRSSYSLAYLNSPM
jgi:hypothetical protein